MEHDTDNHVSIFSIPDDILIFILTSSKSLPVNKVMRQIKEDDIHTSLEKKITKISKDKLNYTEIYYLAKLYVNDINIFKNKCSLNILKESLEVPHKKLLLTNNLSLVSLLKKALLNPTKKLFLTNCEKMKQSNDEHIILYINPINDNYFDLLLNLIFFCIDIKKTFTCITLYLTDINFQIFKNSFNTIILALKLNIPLKLLILKNNQIDNKVIAIAEALKTNTTLLKLALDGNYIISSGVRVLAEALNINTTLVTLNLNSNKIYRSGISALAKTLKINKTLKTLYLKFTSIDKEGAKLIANALKQNTTLLKLDIQQNSKFGDEGAKEFADALIQNTTLTELCVGNNDIRDEGATALATALKTNTTLLKLDIVQPDYIYFTFNKDIFTPYLSRVMI
jgi:hypothetical protein